MTFRNFNNPVRLIFLAVIFLLFFTGLQSAFGCPVQGSLVYNPEIRIDSCHLVINQKKSAPCCQSEACHQTVPRQHNFDGPEYQNLHHDPYLLVHEARPLTPQLKVGGVFTPRDFRQSQLLVSREKPLAPRQALHNLRTVVLLN